MADQGFTKTQLKQLGDLFTQNEDKLEKRLDKKFSDKLSDSMHWVVESLSVTITGVESRLNKRMDSEVERLENLIKSEAESTRDEVKSLATTTPTIYQVNNHEVRIGKLEKKVFTGATA